MAEIEISLDSKIAFLLVFSIICLVHLIPLIKYSIPVNWDSGFYYYHIANKIDPLKNFLEPLYFFIAYGWSSIIGIIPTMKLLQFLPIVILAYGTYLFVGENYNKTTALVVMLFVTMIPATTRQFADQYRNMWALSFLPLLFYTSLKNEKKYVIYSGLLLGLIGLTHRMIFIYSGLALGIYSIFNVKFTHVVTIFLIAGSVASIYLLYVLIPSSSYEVSSLFKWEQPPFNFTYIVSSTFYLVTISITSLLWIIFNKDYKKQNLLLLSFFGVAFILMTGIAGTPFLLYERYLLLFSVISMFFTAPYLFNLFDKIEKTNILILAVSVIMVIVSTLGIRSIVALTPFVSESELTAFTWINENLPHDSILLIPSREHYWASSFTGMKVLPMEWYSLLGEKPQTNETLVITGTTEDSRLAVKILKEKYNVTNAYIFFTLGSDPIPVNDYFQQQSFTAKAIQWIQIRQFDNSFLFQV